MIHDTTHFHHVLPRAASVARGPLGDCGTTTPTPQERRNRPFFDIALALGGTGSWLAIFWAAWCMLP